VTRCSFNELFLLFYAPSLKASAMPATAMEFSLAWSVCPFVCTSVTPLHAPKAVSK